MGYHPPLKLMQARSILKNIGYKVWFFQIGKINRKPIPKKKRIRKPKPPKCILPDLMAEMLTAAPKIAPTEAVEAAKEPIIPIAAETVARYLKPKKEILKMSHPIQKPLHTPNPVGRNITRMPQLEKPEPKIQRPPCRYTNIPSPYGIASQMLQEQMEEELKRKIG